MANSKGSTPGSTYRQRPANEGATHTPHTPRVAPALGGWVHAEVSTPDRALSNFSPMQGADRAVK